MLAAMADFEHDLLVERTKEGLAAARARRHRGGGVVKMTATKAAQVRVMYEARGHTAAESAGTPGVSRAMMYRHLSDDASLSRIEKLLRVRCCNKCATTSAFSGNYKVQPLVVKLELLPMISRLSIVRRSLLTHGA